jgi:hypothetical protein
MGVFAISALGLEGITKLRGKWQSVESLGAYDWETVPVMPTFHPAHVLYSEDKREEIIQEIMEDFIKVREKLWGIGLHKNIESINIRSKLLGEDILIGKGGVPLSEIWKELKGGG